MKRHQPPGPHDLSAGSTSRTLISGARGDDAAAWTRLVALYTPLVAYWCRQSRVPERDLADIVQEVFRSVSTNLKRFRTDLPGSTFRGWLRTGHESAAKGVDGQLEAVAHPELVENRRQVIADGRLADRQAFGNVLVSPLQRRDTGI